jgi:lipoprotein-anchoring transpeptidase ErfK/SrfK
MRKINFLYACILFLSAGCTTHAEHLKIKSTSTQNSSDKIFIDVDISDQKLSFRTGTDDVQIWDISTARAGKITPIGQYTPNFLSKHHKSSLYNNAPMPYSIFFHGNYAIHGTYEINKLGMPASAGCIRLHPDNAKIIFKAVENRNFKDVVINIEE